MPFTDTDLQACYPWIPWREPWIVRHRSSGDQIFICRFCVGQYGLDVAAHLDNLYRTREEFDTHLAMFHPRKEDNANDR